MNPCTDDRSGTGHPENRPDDSPPETEVGISDLPGSGRLVEGEAHQDRIKDSENDSDDELHGSHVGWSEDAGSPGSDAP